MGLESDSRVLTFLIADVRGYTSYTQAHGDEAAARLAGAFAEIAREGVEAHGGDVIELRGTKRSRCSNARPRRSGPRSISNWCSRTRSISIPTFLSGSGSAWTRGGRARGGRVSRGALNLAARLCSKAGPGEVLASQGVMQGAGAVEGLGFHDHGAFEMKGITEPVHVARQPGGSRSDALAARFTRNGRASPTATEVRERSTPRPRSSGATETSTGCDGPGGRRGARGSMIPVLGPQGSARHACWPSSPCWLRHDGAEITYASLRGPLDAAILESAFDPGPRPSSCSTMRKRGPRRRLLRHPVDPGRGNERAS